MTITVKYDEDAKPGEGTYFKLDTNRDYETRIFDYPQEENGKIEVKYTSRQNIPYLEWHCEVKVNEGKWRKLPKSALRTQMTGGGRKFYFRLAASIGLVPPNYDGIGSEFTAEESDFLGTVFLSRIKYNGEFPEIAFVRPLATSDETIELPM